MEAPAKGGDLGFAAAIERVRGLRQHPDATLRECFRADAPIFVARAPGRLDVMGGIADYSGSLVLEMPIAEAAFVSVQASDESGVVVASVPAGGDAAARIATFPPDYWSRLCAVDYDTVRRVLRETPESAWAAYVLGPVFVLMREAGVAMRHGLRIVVDSQVPEGKGLSSSAAIEVATLRAVAALCGIELAGEEIARLCQLAENRIAGAACGIMDQMTSALGRENELLALRCQPATVEGFVPMPSELAFWAIDSGIRHAVSAADYSSVRCGAFMGYRMIAEAAGISARAVAGAQNPVKVDDPRWRGYLANLTPSEFHDGYEAMIPERIAGGDFLDRFGGTTDSVTWVDPAQSYAVLAPTRHPIEENARVERFRDLLGAPISDATLNEMGALMYASHKSYTACGLASDGTDLIVELVQHGGTSSGLYGGKITGGGSGGTVAILGRADASHAAERVARQYAAATGRPAAIFRGSSPGACSSPVVQVII